MTRFSRLVLCLLVISVGPTALATFAPAVPFYRSPESPFPSGQAPAEALQKNAKTQLTRGFDLVRKDHREYRLPTEQVLRDLDLSLQAVNIARGEVGLIVRSRPPWYEWVSEAGAHEWLPAERLAPDPADPGLVQLVTDAGLRQTPDAHSEVVLEGRRGQRFRLLGFAADSVLVQSLDSSELRGFLPLVRVILKLDFASHVMNEHGAWQSFAYREGASATLSSFQKWRLADIRAVLTTPGRGIIDREVPERGLVPRSIVEIRKTEWVQWAQSELKGHGSVYWKRQEPFSLAKNPSEVLSTDEILTRKFVSVATHPRRPEEALVSGSSVYFTHDGKSWVKLAGVPGEDLPVAINTNGDLFVGGFVSRDQGKSFHPFLRWQDLTPFLESSRRLPGLLRLAEIKTAGTDQVEISLDTGASRVRLAGSNRYGLVTDWKILR